MSQWKPLSAGSGHRRFTDIMRQMDRRYTALNVSELERWLQRKTDTDKHPELYGWFAGEGRAAADLRQVMAVTSNRDADGRRIDLGLPMLGVAADVIPESQWTEADRRMWLSRFLLGVKSLIGIDREFRAIRPKTMTFQPMQQLHDLMRDGIEFDSDDSTEGRLFAEVHHEKDLGDSLYWKMKISPVERRTTSKLRAGQSAESSLA